MTRHKILKTGIRLILVLQSLLIIPFRGNVTCQNHHSTFDLDQSQSQSPRLTNRIVNLMDRILNINANARWGRCTRSLVVGDTTDSKEQQRHFEFDQLVSFLVQLQSPLELRTPGNATSVGLTERYFHFSPQCTLFIYFIEDFGKLEKLINNFSASAVAVRKRRSMIFNSYHMILLEKNMDEKLLFNSLSIKQLHNLLIANFVTGQLSTTNVWFNESLPLSLSAAAADLFPNKWKDFGGGQLILATTADIGLDEMETYEKTGVVRRFLITCTFEFLKYLNATPVRFPRATTHYGRRYENGSWDGVIGAMLNGEAQLTTSSAIFYDRYQILLYTTPYYYNGFSFITGPPKKIGNGSDSFLALLAPFQLATWVGFLVAFLSMIVMLRLLGFPENRNGNGNYWRRISILVQPMLEQHANLNWRGTGGTRVKRSLYLLMLGLWLMAATTLSSFYKTVVISILLSPSYTTPPRLFAELVDSDYDIGGLDFTGSLLRHHMSKLSNKIGREVSKRGKEFPLYLPECYELTKNGHQSCIGISTIVEFSSYHFLTDKNGQHHFLLSREMLFPFMGAIAIPFHFPHTLENLNKIIGRTTAQGLPNYWLSLEGRANQLLGRKWDRKLQQVKGQTSNGGNDVNSDQKYMQLRYFSNILAFGYGLALLVFCVETIFKYVQRWSSSVKSSRLSN